MKHILRLPGGSTAPAVVVPSISGNNPINYTYNSIKFDPPVHVEENEEIVFFSNIDGHEESDSLTIEQLGRFISRGKNWIKLEVKRER